MINIITYKNMQVIRHGKYKSAVEMFMLDKMSDANREQYTAMITGMWATILADISASRNISKDQLNTIADNLDALDADKALASGMVDGLFYKVEMPLVSVLAAMEINGISIDKDSFGKIIVNTGQAIYLASTLGLIIED